MSDIVHNERVKLTCALFNGLAVGSVIAGDVAPIAASFYGVSNVAWSNLTIGAAIWFLAGTVLHLAARRLLQGLKS